MASQAALKLPFERILAPMVEQCDLAFRMLVRKYNCTLCYSQMFHSTILSTKKDYFLQHFTTTENDSPLVIQICGNDPIAIRSASQLVIPFCKRIDLNLGCPQGIARKGGYGAYLLPKYDRIEEIVKCLNEGDNRIPYSVKIRLLPNMKNTIRLCEMIQNNGAQCIVVHARLREEKRENTGKSDWNAIRTIVKSVDIPVIANGGIDSVASAIECVNLTGVKGVMSGEGLLENPSLFCDDNEMGVDEMCYEYLDMVEKYPCQPKEIRKHMFKLLYRSLQRDKDSQMMLSTLPLRCEDDMMKVRLLIRHLRDVMNKDGDDWLIKDCLMKEDSFYRRYRSKELIYG